MTDETQGNLRREELETVRADVVAHVAALPRSERRRLRDAIDATLARIDARISELHDEPAAPADGTPADPAR